MAVGGEKHQVIYFQITKMTQTRKRAEAEEQQKAEQEKFMLQMLEVLQ